MVPVTAGRIESSHGFSLLEVLVATAIVVVAVTSLAQFFIISTNANIRSKTTTLATILAVQKIEQLRALAWGFDSFGLPISDTTTDTTTVPESATGGTGLTPSPAGTLTSNTRGYVDYLDASGTSLGSPSPTTSGAAVFVRRWSIEPLPTNPGQTLVLQVSVVRSNRGGAARAAVGKSLLSEEAHLVTVKTRKAM